MVERLRRPGGPVVTVSDTAAGRLRDIGYSAATDGGDSDVRSGPVSPSDTGPGTTDARQAPAKTDPKTAWVDHAVAGGVDRDEAEAMTKAELVALYG